MGIGQALSLPQELAAGGDDDDHIQAVGSMQILVLYLSQVGGFGVGMAHIEGKGVLEVSLLDAFFACYI